MIKARKHIYNLQQVDKDVRDNGVRDKKVRDDFHEFLRAHTDMLTKTFIQLKIHI